MDTSPLTPDHSLANIQSWQRTALIAFNRRRITDREFTELLSLLQIITYRVPDHYEKMLLLSLCEKAQN